MGGGMMGVGLGLGGLLVMFLFWGGLIALAVWLVGTLFPRAARPAASDERDLTVWQILDRRYARGEISREQYDLMKRDLSMNQG